MKATADQEIGSLQAECFCGHAGLVGGGRHQPFGHWNLIESIDAQDFFDDICRTGYVVPICGNVHNEGGSVVAGYSDLQVFEDGVNRMLVQRDSNQLMQLRPFQGDGLSCRQIASIGFVQGSGCAIGPFGNQRRCSGEGCFDHRWINAPLKAE